LPTDGFHAAPRFFRAAFHAFRFFRSAFRAFRAFRFFRSAFRAFRFFRSALRFFRSAFSSSSVSLHPSAIPSMFGAAASEAAGVVGLEEAVSAEAARGAAAKGESVSWSG
jgi:hypothetical protein